MGSFGNVWSSVGEFFLIGVRGCYWLSPSYVTDVRSTGEGAERVFEILDCRTGSRIMNRSFSFSKCGLRRPSLHFSCFVTFLGHLVLDRVSLLESLLNCL